MAMSDEGIYEYLQITIQKYLHDTRKSHEEVTKCLDILGFRVGYQLIERYTNLMTFLTNIKINDFKIITFLL